MNLIVPSTLLFKKWIVIHFLIFFQTFVEAVYLNDDEVLNLQTNEEHHIFQWLKLQASRGAAEAEVHILCFLACRHEFRDSWEHSLKAQFKNKVFPLGIYLENVLQQTLARMLFWGQQGVSPNIQKAVIHYERGAVQWEDPASMYNYGIVLLQVRVTPIREPLKWLLCCYSFCVLLHIMYILFPLGSWSWQGHPKSCHFPKESNGPGCANIISSTAILDMQKILPHIYI